MNTNRNLQLLFDRPSEPVFTTKGNENVVFDVPAHYLTDRYQTFGQSLSNRYGENASEHIPVKSVQSVNLGEIEQLSRYDAFSIFVPKHRRLACALVDIFLGCTDTDNLISTSLYCKDRVNPAMYNYALSIAMLHRPDTRNVPVPTLIQTFPDRFINSAVFSQAREEAQLVSPELRSPIVIPRDFTASDLDEEHRVAYWREDIGNNLHHWHWHLVYPFESNTRAIVAKDRRGELFYYMHEQILARYNFERLANQLARVKQYNNFREPVKEGYFPKLQTILASRGWTPRQENMMIQDLDRPVDEIRMTVSDFEIYIRRIYDAIHSGMVMDRNGGTIVLDEIRGIDVLGDLIEASMLSVNPDYYGNVHNFGHLFLGYIHDPEGKYLERPGIMADPATDLRDPIFFRWHAFIDEMFQDYKATIPRYTRGLLNNPDIRLTDVVVNTEGGSPNVFDTFWMQSDLDLSRGLDFVERGGIFVRHTHLNHSPFTYNITVNNTGPAKMGTVRIYLSPKFDERGLPWQFREHRLMFIEMDKFFTQLQPGNNNIVRRSDESSVTIPYERTFRNLETGRDATDADSFNFCGCGHPQHLLVPRGTPSGMACQLFVMVSNYELDKVEQSLEGSCADAASYCGIKDKLYPDRRSMGYPFDRFPPDNVGTLEDFMTPNMIAKDVTIRFSDRTVLNPRNTTNVPPQT
ncbi:phenoloxidase 2-like [Arctopsyche grandis]|uniref:phenoloxidase 2-like n=1 Tax=Arctopsyche grandis TaxID=121162 RepID=UPI00406D6538